MYQKFNLKKSSTKENIRHYLQVSVDDILAHPEHLSPKPGHELEEKIVLGVLKQWHDQGSKSDGLRKIVRNVKYLHEIDNNLEPMLESTSNKNIFKIYIKENFK